MSESKKHLIKKIVAKAKGEEADGLSTLIIALAVGGMILLGAFLYIMNQNKGEDDIAGILPTTKTAGFLEVSSLSLPTKLQNTPGFSQELWKSAITSLTGIPNDAIEKVWENGSFGVALILDSANVSQPVFFAEASKGSTLRALKTLGLDGEKPVAEGTSRIAIYSFPKGQGFHFTFAGGFVLMSKEKAVLQSIQSVQEEGQSILAQEDYAKTTSQLPRSSWMRGYADVHNIYLKDRFLVNNLIEPLKFAVNHTAFTVRQNPNGFHFNTFVNLNKNLLSLEEGRITQSKFTHRLTDIIPADGMGIYFGGENLSDEWQNSLATIANLNPAYGVILESILRAQVTKIFGEKVDMRNDIYPLFEGEYGLTISPQVGGGNTFALTLSHNDKTFTQIKMAKLLDGFRLLAMEFTPKIHTVILPDGTESRELVANDERPEEKVEKVDGKEVHCVEVEDSVVAFCYTITDNLLVMASSRKNVEGALALTDNLDGSLSNFQPFRTTLSSVSKVTDEITFINVPNTLPLVERHPYGIIAKPFLESFEAFAWVKHYFEDGVSTEGYLLLK